jgi:hypothetical protein
MRDQAADRTPSAESLLRVSRAITDALLNAGDGSEPLLDTAGRDYLILRSGTIAVAAPLGTDFSAAEIAREIDNGGAVGIAVGPARTRISYRPEIVSGPALDVAKCFIRSFPSRPVQICELVHEPHELCFAGPTAASAWLVAKRGAEPITACRRDVSDAQSDPRYNALLEWWRGTGGRFDPDLVSFLVQHKLFERTTIAVERKSDRALNLEHVGNQLLSVTWIPDWQFATSSRPLTAFPDKAYAAWTEDRFRAAININAPAFDRVDAILGATEDDPYHSRYDRLLLPMQSTDGTRRTVTLSYRVPHTSVMAA